MGMLSKLLGKKSAGAQARAEDLARSQKVAAGQDLAGRASIQSQGEQDLTRDRMETELAGQRQRREDARNSDA